MALEVTSREREGGETRRRVGYTLPRPAREAAGNINGAVCGMHTTPSQSYPPLLARTTLQEDPTMPTRHVGCTPPRVGVCAHTRAPPRCLFPPLSPPGSLLLANSACWLWLQAPCDAAVDVVYNVAVDVVV
jgi:hypothetical protein